jgi:hypothetical protein
MAKWVINTYLGKARSGLTCMPNCDNQESMVMQLEMSQVEYSNAYKKIIERTLLSEIESIYQLLRDMYIGFTQIGVLQPGSGVSETISLLEPWVL